MSGLMKSTFSFSDKLSQLARRPPEVSTTTPLVTTAFCSDVRQQALFQDDLTVVA